MSEVLLMTGQGAEGAMAYHELAKRFSSVHVIREQPISRVQLTRRRVKRLGVATVAGQLAFQLGVAPLLGKVSAHRNEEILGASDLIRDPIPEDSCTDVSSINDPEAAQVFARERPKVVTVVGTRIIGKKLLGQISVPILNLHAGITPAYRGVHGGYWALYAQDIEHCGVTVHRVDVGIDTGGVLAQKKIVPSAEDNYATYPSLQLVAGLPLLAEVAERAAQGDLASTAQPPENSTLYYHPTIGQYLYGWFMYGVR